MITLEASNLESKCLKWKSTTQVPFPFFKGTVTTAKTVHNKVKTQTFKLSMEFFSLFSTLRTRSQTAMPMFAIYMALAYFTLGVPSTLTTFMNGIGWCAGSSSRHRDVKRELEYSAVCDAFVKAIVFKFDSSRSEIRNPFADDAVANTNHVVDSAWLNAAAETQARAENKIKSYIGDRCEAEMLCRASSVLPKPSWCVESESNEAAICPLAVG